MLQNIGYNLSTPIKNTIQKHYENKLDNNLNRDKYIRNPNDNRISFTGICSKHFLHHIYDELSMFPALLKIKLTRYDSEEVLEARQQQALMQLQMKNKYGVISTDQLQDREKLRDDISETLIQNGKPVPEGIKPEAVFVVGIPGAGKTSVLENLTKQGDNYVSIDMDEPGHYLPEYKELFPGNHKEKFYYLLFLESKDISDRALDKAIDKRYNVIIHNPGLDYRELKDKAIKLNKAGYNVRLKFMQIDTDEAEKRCMERYRNGGRFADPMIHARLGNHPFESYIKLTRQHPELFSSYEAYSNNVKSNKTPILLEKHETVK